MSSDPHFSAVSLWSRLAWEDNPAPIREGYILLFIDPNAGEWVGALRRAYPGAVRDATVYGKQWLRVQARTGADGWLMARAGTSLVDPKHLDSMTPLVLPLGARFRVWWTANEALFDERLAELDSGDAILDPAVVPGARMLLDVDQPIPPPVQRRLDALGETLAAFQANADETFPEQLMRSVDAGDTRAIVLEDEALETAIDLAYGLLDAAGIAADVLPDQALINAIQDIVTADGKLASIVERHKHDYGGDYSRLQENFASLVSAGGAVARDNGKALRLLFARAVEQLRAHPYEQDRSDERFAVLLRATILGNAEEVASKLYDTGKKGEAQRLLKIVQGKAPPTKDDFAEFAMYQLKQWINHAAKAQGHSAKVSEIVAKTTQWTADVLHAAIAADAQVVRKVAVLQQGMDISVRMILALDGKVVEAGVRVESQVTEVAAVTGSRRISPNRVSEAARFTAAAKVLGRISDLIKVANGLALLDKVLSGEEVTMLELLGDLAGTVEGFETLYRLKVGIEATTLGTVLGEVSGVLGVAIGLQKAWGHLEAGKSEALLAESAGIGMTIMALSLRLAARPAPPHVTLLLLVGGAAAAVLAELSYTEQEKVLEAYNPTRDGGGPYGDARHKARRLERKVDQLRLSDAAQTRVEKLAR